MNQMMYNAFGLNESVVKVNGFIFAILNRRSNFVSCIISERLKIILRG